MATAVENTIPCDRCGTQIDFDDWSTHLRQCTGGARQSPRKTEESTNVGIPCEFCQAQIALDDWESHSKQCRDLQRRETARQKEGFGEETTITYIPCEYCDESIDMHKYEWHTRQCQKSKKPRIDSANGFEMIEGLIPCENCDAQVLIEDYELHTQQCRGANKQSAKGSVGDDGGEPSIPCEYCDKTFPFSLINDHQTECRRLKYAADYEGNPSAEIVVGGKTAFPDTWTWNASAMNNLSIHNLPPNGNEYKMVSDKFHQTLPSNQIVKIERIQNRRWYRQFDAHRDDFIERHGKSTEQWLFHGCKSKSSSAIINDCFNRSHAVRCAAGQGIYFATQASTSLSYTQPDSKGQRHMFMARVLVGRTAAGDQSTRVCPPGYDTTGGGSIFVTYHDAQAYGEYLITFR